MPQPSEALIWIEADGSARELTAAEKKHVDAEFGPFDGARPYVKSRHDERNGWGELAGYLQRDKLPPTVAINPAPAEPPAPAQTPQAVARSILGLVRKHRPGGA